MKKSIVVGSLLGLVFHLSAASVNAAELRILAGGGIAPALGEIKTQFEAATGHKLTIMFATTPDLIKESTSGAPFDAGVVPSEVMQNAAARGRFAETTDVARVGYGVAVRAGAPKPDLSTAEAFKRAMLAAPSIATVPESAAGAQVLRVFARIGIADEMKAKTKAVGSPPQIVQAVVQGEATFGLFLTSVFVVPGVEIAGQFPGELQQDLVYTAAASANVRDAAATKAFLDYLKTPAAIGTLRSKGMRPG
jgi:molybdate transport system substrate-binding protein